MQKMTLAQVRKIGDGNTGIEISEAALCAMTKALRARSARARADWSRESERLRPLADAADKQALLLSSIVIDEIGNAARFDAATTEANAILAEGVIAPDEIRTRIARAFERVAA